MYHQVKTKTHKQMADKKRVLVFGVTGLQGGSVTRALIAKGYEVVGVTRNIGSERAKVLVTEGVKLVQGDIFEAEKLVGIMSKVDAVFAVTTPYEEGAEREMAQGTALVEAAKKAEVKHLVFSSVSDADQNTGIPHFESKYKIEQEIISSGAPYTIVAPVYFMENLLSPWTIDTIKAGKVSMAFPADKLLQQISTEDIGKFVAEVVEGGEKHFGQRINIAGEELTGEELVKKLSAISEKDFVYEGFSPEFLKETMPDVATMFEWFDKVGYSANIEQLKADFPNISLTSYEAYLKKQDWNFLQ